MNPLQRTLLERSKLNHSKFSYFLDVWHLPHFQSEFLNNQLGSHWSRIYTNILEHLEYQPISGGLLRVTTKSHFDSWKTTKLGNSSIVDNGWNIEESTSPIFLILAKRLEVYMLHFMLFFLVNLEIFVQYPIWTTQHWYCQIIYPMNWNN